MEFTRLFCFQNGSSLMTHDPLTFGYVTHFSLSPNAELLSTRRPAGEKEAIAETELLLAVGADRRVERLRLR